MRFHWPSFFLGCAAGAVGVLVARHFRPVVVEVATVAYQLLDSVGTRVTEMREDLEDSLAEARARARRPRARSRARA